MASIGQVIFWSMIVLIVVFAAIIILILALTFAGNPGSVESSDKSPIGNLGDDVILSCYLSSTSEGGAPQASQVSITWEKEGLSGVVYQYQGGSAELKEQNVEFKDRTQLFPNVIAGGNASLLLRGVRVSDQGVYSCHVSAPSGWGIVNINLRVAAFSAPKFSLTGNNLTAEAQKWFPKPNVTWTNHVGDQLNGTTRFFNNSAGIFRLVSSLQSITTHETYTCLIQNPLVMSVSKATLTGTEISDKTFFTFNAASSSQLASLIQLLLTVVLWMYLLN